MVWQALQLALNSAETRLRTVQRENETLVQQLMALKAQDADRMNFENDQFLQRQQQLMQAELAEAVKEQKSITPDRNSTLLLGGECEVAGECLPSRVGLRFEAHEGEVMSVRWDWAGRYFATAGADRKIKIWEVSKGVQVSQSDNIN